MVTRLNGPTFAVNPDLIERVESNPDTVLTLVDGTKYVIAEALTEVISLIREYRASVIAAAGAQEMLLRREAARPRRRADGAPEDSAVIPLNRDR